MMKVVDFNSTHVAKGLRELETILLKRHGKGLNAFWLSHESQEYPTLSILVKGDLAALHYIPTEHEAGFRSVGKMPSLDPRGTTSFSISENAADDVEELNDAVLPFSVALSVAKDFFASNELPAGVEWLEL
jgi:hypothetical protein